MGVQEGKFSPADLAWKAGTADWIPLSSMLPALATPAPQITPQAQSFVPNQAFAPVNPSPTVVQVVGAPPPRSAGGVSLASWILLALCCLGSIIPGLGFGVWLIAIPVLLVTFILGIIAITRGGTFQGILILVATLIVVPLFVLIAPIITTGAAISAAAEQAEKESANGTNSTVIQTQ